MSIRAKILLGCLSLAMVTIVVGMLARGAQQQVGAIALRIYDEAFMSMSYLRSAQNGLLTVSRQLSEGVGVSDALATRLEEATGDLEIARLRAMSGPGQAATAKLHDDVAHLAEALRRDGKLAGPEQLAPIERGFDSAVEIYAGDGYRFRRAVVAVVAQASLQAWLAMALSLAVALAITLALSRAIVPSLRHAVDIAASIAAGRLDNRIDARGHSETGILLRALAAMQASLAAFMAQQASSHATEIATQHARFEAALENMTQGLCMFDAQGCLLVHNRRFAAMFGAPAAGATTVEVLPAALLSRDAPTFTRTLNDGRTIAVSEQPMQGGGWVATYEDATERHRVEARLAHMARHDPLTGLPNRTLYREQMDHALAQVRDGGALAVLCLDLDRFTMVNDTFGHTVGDALLRATAERLLAATAETDMLVRLGGDEFAVIQCSPDQPDDAQSLAERLLAALAAPFDIEGCAIAIGASIGIAVTNDSQATADGMLIAADLALYRAKADGRGAYRFFEADMDAQVQARRLLERDLRCAVAERQFAVHYQPLITTATGEVCGFEALVRWNHPVRGMVSPAEFIPLAEELGLISAIGAWVLEQACKDAVSWPANIKLAVNLSPLQFRDHDVVQEVAGALERSGFPARRLELEITESVLLQENEATLDTLHRLRAIGAKISMDDFGTGYSSLSYLRRFPFDKIKIDQSFIRNLDERGDCIAIVRAVVGLGRSLGMSVIAEGVETEEQRAMLRAEGCHQLQGYLFSPPRPALAIPLLIERFAMREAA